MLSARRVPSGEISGYPKIPDHSGSTTDVAPVRETHTGSTTALASPAP